MPNQAQLLVWERRDNTDRNDFANASLALCRSIKTMTGVTSSRFYWYNADTIVIWTEGEASAFEMPPEPNVAKAFFTLADLAQTTRNWRLADARLGADTYRAAGR
jgi:hypothetical protein